MQETQYDPTGLELVGFTRDTPGLKPLNQYRWNGKENQLDLGLNWNHQDWRFFDAQLGRWHVVDPEIENGQERWTPYSFGFDNAIRYADADGRCPGGKCPPDPLRGNGNAASQPDLITAVEGSLKHAYKEVKAAVTLEDGISWTSNTVTPGKDSGKNRQGNGKQLDTDIDALTAIIFKPGEGIARGKGFIDLVKYTLETIGFSMGVLQKAGSFS